MKLLFLGGSTLRGGWLIGPNIIFAPLPPKHNLPERGGPTDVVNFSRLCWLIFTNVAVGQQVTKEMISNDVK